MGGGCQGAEYEGEAALYGARIDTGISTHPASKTIERRSSGSRLPKLGHRRSRCLSGMLLSALAAISNFPARTHLSRFLCASDGDDLCRYIASVSVAIFMSPLLSFLPHTSAATSSSPVPRRDHMLTTARLQRVAAGISTNCWFNSLISTMS